MLINAHYDSTLGSPGASDCASCVGVAVEVVRALLSSGEFREGDSLTLLLYGGEETLMQGSYSIFVGWGDHPTPRCSPHNNTPAR